MSSWRVLILCIPVICLGLAYEEKFHCYDELWYPITLSYICKINSTLFRQLNHFDIKRLIFLQGRICFCQNKEKGVTKRYQLYTCLTSHNLLTIEQISKFFFLFSFRYIALSSSCIRYEFGPANKNSFALLFNEFKGDNPNYWIVYVFSLISVWKLMDSFVRFV